MKRIKKKEHLKERLLEHGLEMFTEHGYHGTGLKKVLDKASVPKGSFYNFFESKEQYVAEVIELYSRNTLADLDQYIESTQDDPVTCIKNIHYYLIDMHEKNGLKGCLIGNLSAEIGNLSKKCQLTMMHAQKAWAKRFIQLIQEAQKQGLIRNDLSADVLSNLIWNTWQGGLLQMKIKGGTASLKQSFDSLMDVLFK